jgi:hypothetical protein
MEKVETVHSLFPGGRNFGQTTQKRPQKNVYGRKQLEAGKLQSLEKVEVEKRRSRKTFLQLFKILCFILDFVQEMSKKYIVLNFQLHCRKALLATVRALQMSNLGFKIVVKSPY